MDLDSIYVIGEFLKMLVYAFNIFCDLIMLFLLFKVVKDIRNGTFRLRVRLLFSDEFLMLFDWFDQDNTDQE